ncbi:unnamed protein product [Adineta steineri]|uniref:NHL repeat containing protein-like protein n=1 Tax=Adineta steineri TaxID=433720 RepID=A0A815WGW8_9BILA|nr:unnamed protein product [Adineta steineri]CAF1545160.1 unnamed protein product [Adineta steineri]
MILIENFKLCLTLSIIGQLSGLSFNQPKLCPAATWGSIGTVFAGYDIIHGMPYSIFITTNNSIYVVVQAISHIYIWLNNSVNPTITITESSSYPQSIFVKNDNELYIERVTLSKRNIEKWILSTNRSTPVMNVITSCYSIFIDILNNLYCSHDQQHKVVKNWLDDDDTTPMIVAGTGFAGPTSNTLYSPSGLFIDANLNLYVADFGNHRIQKFRSGESHGITVAGATSLNITTSLNYPTGVTMDGDGYLYIIDSNKNRIVRGGLNGFQCILGCVASGLAANQLSGPRDMAFDSNGNIYVADSRNGRIQKFSYSKTSCDPITNVSLIASSRSPSFNQPKFCPAAAFNPFGTTFAANNIIHGMPYSIFITTNNSIYVVAHALPNIYIWLNNSVNPTITITEFSTYPQSIFVRNDNELYFERVTLSKRNIEKWILSTNRSTPVMNIIAPCYSIFIDILNNLYCSHDQQHKVVKNWLDDDDTTPMIVAGTGFAGPTSNTLYSPYGVFVDASLNLYVADFGNHRIQMFPQGESQGITVAGEKSINITIRLLYPTGVTMDGDGYLYIVDSYNRRIVRGGSTGFRCIIGCITLSLAGNQLSGPRHMAFDSYGNIYVADSGNGRIQKFSYAKVSCNPITNVSLLTSSRSLSFNQPKFCPAATWNSFGTTFFAGNNIIRGTPDSIFITTNNSIYVLAQRITNIYIWLNSSVDPTITISDYSSSSRSIFVQNDNEFYIVRGNSNKHTIEKWILNTNSSTPVMDIVAPCYSIFIDIVNNLYCSLNQYHIIMKNWLDDDDTTPMIVAGTGVYGPTSNTLTQPSGLFVDGSLNLYIADSGNHRIQMFPQGESHGITVTGATSINTTIRLNYPTGVTMDGDGYLYIVDSNKNRIVRGGSTGFRCILGCITSGSESYKLSWPRDMAFDSDGNIYVVDAGNQRIQKFSYPKLSCEPTTTITRTTSSPVASHSTKALAGYFIQCLMFFMLYI